MSIRWQLAVICTVFFVLSGCATLKKVIQEPTVSFKNVTPQNLSLTQGTFLFNFDVSNPNPLGLTLNKISYDLRINEKNLIKDSLDKGIKIPSKGNTVMSIPITVQYADMFRSLTEALASDSVAYDLNGTVGIGPFSIPYNHQGKLDMPKLPEIALEDISIGKLSLDGAALNVKLKLKNPNDFNVDLTSLNYAIKLHGKEFAKGVAQNVSSITANGENLLNLNLNLNFKELGQAAMSLIKRTKTDYEIMGDIIVRSAGKETDQRIPFLKSGQIPLR